MQDNREIIEKKRRRLRRADRKYIRKMVLLFVMDLVVAALMVLGYYWITYRTSSNTMAPVPIQLSTTAQTLGTTISAETTGNVALLTTENSGETIPSVTDKETTEFLDESSEEQQGGDQSEMAPENPTEAPTEAPTEPPTEAPTEPPTEPPTKDRSQMTWAEKFADKFTPEPVITANSYSDSNISVTVTTHNTSEPVEYFIADIYVTDIRYFGAGIYANDPTFNSQCSRETYARENPLYRCFINGDFCGYNKQGLIIRNGMLYRDNPSDVEQLVMFADGSMRCFAPNVFTVDMATSMGAIQSWCFGPSLLNDDGSVRYSFQIGDYITRKHPRTAMGYVEPGHYIFMVVDGRMDSSVGMTLPEMSQVMHDLGCVVAYNLDGGASSSMMLNGNAVNRADGRFVSDYVVVSSTPLF